MLGMQIRKQVERVKSDTGLWMSLDFHFVIWKVVAFLYLSLNGQGMSRTEALVESWWEWGFLRRLKSARKLEPQSALPVCAIGQQTPL